MRSFIPGLFLGFLLATLLGATYVMSPPQGPTYPEHTYFMSVDMEPNAYGPHTLDYWGAYLLNEGRSGATMGTFCLGHARGYNTYGPYQELKPEERAGFNGSMRKAGWFPFITKAKQLLPPNQD